MAMLRIPHLSDNYFEVCSSLSAIIGINDVIHAKQIEIVEAITRNEVYDEDPEVNASISSGMITYTENNVARLSVYSYILLICAGIEKAVRLLQKDGLDKKSKNEDYGEYFKRLGLVPEIADEEINQANDIFILRHWISHRSGRINLQNVSEKEKDVLERAGDNVTKGNEYIIIGYEYVKKIAKSIEEILKRIAKKRYEQ
jgi:hypothetical protein